MTLGVLKFVTTSVVLEINIPIGVLNFAITSSVASWSLVVVSPQRNGHIYNTFIHKPVRKS
jgi:hypothetical protein